MVYTARRVPANVHLEPTILQYRSQEVVPQRQTILVDERKKKAIQSSSKDIPERRKSHCFPPSHYSLHRSKHLFTTMRILLCISVLATLATAFPYPQELQDLSTPAAAPLTDAFPASTTTVPDTTSLNIPVTAVPTTNPDADDDDDDDGGAQVLSSSSSSSRRRPHTEPVPIFTKACKCDLATAMYPCWATDALQVSPLLS